MVYSTKSKWEMDSCSVAAPGRPAEPTACVARRDRAGSLAYRAMKRQLQRQRFRLARFQARVFVILATSQTRVEANILDISAGGARLICSEPLPVGEEVLLVFEVTARNKVQTEEVRGRVFRAQMDDDVWVVEFELTDTPHGAMLHDHAGPA
jgi:hypothetical protein